MGDSVLFTPVQNPTFVPILMLWVFGGCSGWSPHEPCNHPGTGFQMDVVMERVGELARQSLGTDEDVVLDSPLMDVGLP